MHKRQILGLMLLLPAGCIPKAEANQEKQTAEEPAVKVVSATPLAKPLPTQLAKPKPAEPAEPEKPNEAEAPEPPSGEQTKSDADSVCPDGMAQVKGDHCRAVEQECLEYHKNAKGVEDKNRCKRFAPSKCISKSPEPRKMDFCMDRYEYPNKQGELPITLVSWEQAEKLCGENGKRLCTESEFTFACEGEEMRPYAVGFERSDKCNIDQPYSTPKKHMLGWGSCMATPWCAAEFKRVDGRKASGEQPECVSPFGIVDMNGNVNEWVAMPWRKAPHRAAIKGGWWGPVRNRCRAITMAHDESYMGYEVGFRCCKDVPKPKKKRKRRN